MCFSVRSKSNDGGKLDWMYNKDSGKPNNEDYLLGKEITKLGDEEDRSHFGNTLGCYEMIGILCK